MTENYPENSVIKSTPPLISVILPVYNGERYLAEAIDSVLTQTFTDFELIMINDGSTDESLKILKRYEVVDSRICLVTRENRGLPATLNESVELARGQWIARMDQDDVCSPNRFLSQIEFMQLNPTTVVLGSAASFMEEDGSVICTYVIPTSDVELRSVFSESPFIHPSVMFSKEVFNRAGRYTEKMKWGGEDVTLFERMSRFGKLHNLNEPLINYRLVPGSMSRKPPVFRNMLTQIIKDEIAGITVSDERFSGLQQEARKIDKTKADFDYHFEVAKLYIWSGGTRMKTLSHLSKCISLRYKFLKVMLMCFIAMLPKLLITKIYYKLKGRRFGS